MTRHGLNPRPSGRGARQLPRSGWDSFPPGCYLTQGLIRRLKRHGVTQLALACDGGPEADFSMRELED